MKALPKDSHFSKQQFTHYKFEEIKIRIKLVGFFSGSTQLCKASLADDGLNFRLGNITQITSR